MDGGSALTILSSVSILNTILMNSKYMFFSIKEEKKLLIYYRVLAIYRISLESEVGIGRCAHFGTMEL